MQRGWLTLATTDDILTFYQTFLIEKLIQESRAPILLKFSFYHPPIRFIAKIVVAHE